MKPKRPLRETPRKLLTTAIITAIAGFLSYLAIVPLSESLFGKLFSAPETSDFNMSDLYIQFADARPVRHLDDRIVIVDIGYAGREEIAEALEIVAIAEPKVVGLDVNFPYPRGYSDEYLIEGIRSQHEIVLPLALEQEPDGLFNVSERPFFYDSLRSDNIHYGVVNLPAKSQRASIREFETSFRLRGDSVMPSYVVEMARLGDPEAYRKYEARGKERETIDYASREFTVIPIDKLLDRADELTGKYVLIGSLGDAYDMHSTPLNSYQPGLTIHANALATLLDGAWYRMIPDWVDYVISIMLCFLVLFLAQLIPGAGQRTIAIKVFQLLLLIGVVWLGYSLFIDNRIVFELSYTFFVVEIGLLVLDVYDAIEEVALNRKLKKQRLSHA